VVVNTMFFYNQIKMFFLIIDKLLSTFTKQFPPLIYLFRIY